MDERSIVSPLVWFGRFLLSVVLLLFLARLAGFALDFGRDSLQMDFAAFYTAGRAADRGLSPYENHVDAEPPLWDGVAAFEHSRFLYPPPAAELFRPLARLAYPTAKFLWMALSLVALAAAVGISARIANIASPLALLGLGAFTAWFYPVLTLLERGQVDAFILLATVAAVTLMLARPRSVLAGSLLALAALLKPPMAYLVPFLVLRRRWRPLGGFAAGALLLFAAGIAIDARAVREYVWKDLPRIAGRGEGGTRRSALPASSFARLLEGTEPGHTVLDGHDYVPSYFRFVLNATLVQTGWLRATGLRPAALSLGLLALLLSALVAGRRPWTLPDRAPLRDELVYWWIGVTGILLVAPVSWSMGAVLLLPLAPLLLREVPRARSLREVAAWSACALGLLVAGAPDPYGFRMLSPFGEGSLNLKYVIAGALCLAGLFGLWCEPSPPVSGPHVDRMEESR